MGKLELVMELALTGSEDERTLKVLGQQIRDDGPESHQKKAGTPTMGGSLILVALAVEGPLRKIRDKASRRERADA